MGERVVRGVRGAVTIEANDAAIMRRAVGELLRRMQEANGFTPEDIAAVLFTATPDLNADFPAVAAREMGWDRVPLLCAGELNVPASLPRCIRVLALINTTLAQAEVQHIYLGAAAQLRPDLA